MRLAALLLLLMMLAGCGGKPAPAPAPEAVPEPPPPASTPAKPDKKAPPEPQVAGPPDRAVPAPPDKAVPAPPDEAVPVLPLASLKREPVDGGFRIGPFQHLQNLWWADRERIFGVFTFTEGQALATVALDGGALTPIITRREGFYSSLPVLGGRAILFERPGPSAYEQWIQEGDQEPRLVTQGLLRHVSPDATRLVGYSPQGLIFADLRTGAHHVMDAPNDLGKVAVALNSWSADGRRFLVQAGRSNAVPGFYLFDEQGRPTGSFHEPGFYSMWATWSPDGRYVAFLSIPSDVTYPMGESMFEPSVAPRLGLLEIDTGKARYISLEGKVAAGPLRWAPDGQSLAVRFGRLETENHLHMARIVAESVYVVAPDTGQLRPVIGPAVAGEYLTVESWAPDGGSLLLRSVRQDQAQGEGYTVVNLADGRSAKVPGEAIWLDGRRLAAVEQGAPPDYGQTLYLVDDRGQVLRTLARGARIAWLTPHPEGAYLAFMVDTWKGIRMFDDPPATYLYVVQTGGR